VVESAPVARIYGIIPARWGSTRFPGKALHRIAGKPLVQHVWERCREASALQEVIVATDDERIAATVRDFGGRAEMTSMDHPSGTDRLAEVAARLPDATHFINVQGDEPTVPAELINHLAHLLTTEPELEMATAATRLTEADDFANPNVVKVVLAANGDALYFSRSPIPFTGFLHSIAGVPIYGHHGIYGYARDFLRKFVAWPPSMLEQTERLEQLRALENGVRIRVLITDHAALGVDSPEDVPAAESALAHLPQSPLTNNH
jgi:3-deoxy-manno-octulosonate cytidylyltransferase (CMP-KDO synthetase)